jgi:hypothetical protein
MADQRRESRTCLETGWWNIMAFYDTQLQHYDKSTN